MEMFWNTGRMSMWPTPLFPTPPIIPHGMIISIGKEPVVWPDLNGCLLSSLSLKKKKCKIVTQTSSSASETFKF